MTYLDLIQEAEWKVALNKITLDEYDEMIKPLKQEIEPQPCEDCVSRQAVLEVQIEYAEHMGATKYWQMRDAIRALQSVTPQPKIGRWIYDKKIENWRCSECGEIPKTPGYCGSANFMAEHFKYCNHCGAKMEVEG